MSDADLETRRKAADQAAPRPARPPLYRVLLLNDDFTPRDFVVEVLRAEFRLGPETARRVMLTAHVRGVCLVAVYARDVAETKAARAAETGRRQGYPLAFHVEPETGGEPAGS